MLMRCYKSKDRKTLMEPKQGFGYYYALLVCFDGFDTEKPHEKQPRALWDLFELQGSSDFYEMITEYYEDNDLVNVFQKGECDEYNAKDRSVPFNKCLLEDGTKMGFPEGGVRVKKKMMIKVHCSLLAGCWERSFFPTGVF